MEGPIQITELTSDRGGDREPFAGWWVLCVCHGPWGAEARQETVLTQPGYCLHWASLNDHMTLDSFSGGLQVRYRESI